MMRKGEGEERRWLKKGELYPPPFLGPSLNLEKASIEPVNKEDPSVEIYLQVRTGVTYLLDFLPFFPFLLHGSI